MTETTILNLLETLTLTTLTIYERVCASIRRKLLFVDEVGHGENGCHTCERCLRNNRKRCQYTIKHVPVWKHDLKVRVRRVISREATPNALWYSSVFTAAPLSINKCFFSKLSHSHVRLAGIRSHFWIRIKQQIIFFSKRLYHKVYSRFAQC